MTDQFPTIIGNLPTVFADRPDDTSDLGAGIMASFGILTYRGKIFRTKFKGDERAIMRPDEPGSPQSFLDLVIVKASPVISKIYYEGSYQTGDSAPPDCFSVNGLTPDPASPKKQSPHCQTCPRNVWGSRLTEDGRKGKECADNKRMAVSPEVDLRNTAFGGPMMMRCPPASLAGLSTYSADLQRAGGRYYGAVTRVSFDIAKEYPHLLFTPKRWLTNDEARVVIELQDGDVVSRILSEPVEAVKAEGDAPPPVTVGVAAMPGKPPTVQAQEPPPPVQQQAPQPTVVAGGTVSAGSDPYQFTPDGRYRWRAGMANWELVPPAATAPAPVVVTAPDQSGVIVPPNPMAGQPKVDDLAIPAHLDRRTIPNPQTGTGSAFAPATPAPAVVAPPVVVEAAAPTTFAQPTFAPTTAPGPTPVNPGGLETPDQMRARIEAEVRAKLLAEMGAKKPPGRPRTRNPSPANGASNGTGAPEPMTPSLFGAPAEQPGQVTAAPPPPPPPGPGTDALANLNAKLDSLLPKV